MQWGFWVGPSQQLVLGGGFSFSTVSSAPAPGTTGLINSLMNSRWPLSPSHFFKDGWLFFFSLHANYNLLWLLFSSPWGSLKALSVI